MCAKVGDFSGIKRGEFLGVRCMLKTMLGSAFLLSESQITQILGLHGFFVSS